jgi:hypothetical protein
MPPAKLGSMTAPEWAVNIAIASGATPEIAARAGQVAAAATDPAATSELHAERATDLLVRIGRALSEWDTSIGGADVADHSAAVMTLLMSGAKILRMMTGPSGEPVTDAVWTLLAEQSWKATDVPQ